MQREVQISRQLGWHPHIVFLKEFIENEDRCYEVQSERILPRWLLYSARRQQHTSTPECMLQFVDEKVQFFL